jgi:hypothetical protein
MLGAEHDTLTTAPKLDSWPRDASSGGATAGQSIAGIET